MSRTTPRRGRTRQRAPGADLVVSRAGTSALWYDFTIDGQRFRGSCGTDDPALAAAFALKQHREAFGRIRLGEEPEKRLGLEDACTRWWNEAGSLTPYGMSGQRYQIVRILDVLGRATDLATLTDDVVATLVTALRADGLSKATINRYLATLAVVCRRAREVWGVRVGTWTARLHKQREPDAPEVYLDHTQGRALIRAIVPHAQAPILLDLLTGLRKRNLLDLRWEDVSLDLQRALLRQKGDRRLRVELPGAAVDMLTKLEPDPSKRTGPVFWYGNPTVACRCPHCASPLYRGKPIRDIKRSFQTAKRLSGAPPALRFHDLRHTFASWLLAETGNLKLVKDALGHSQITTTMRYAHLGDDSRRQGIEGATAKLMIEPPKAKKEGM
jgi:integrase